MTQKSVLNPLGTGGTSKLFIYKFKRYIYTYIYIYRHRLTPIPRTSHTSLFYWQFPVDKSLKQPPFCQFVSGRFSKAISRGASLKVEVLNYETQ